MTQHIFSTLQRRERLPYPRLKALSGLSDRQLQHALIAMIQHHFVYHFTSLEDGNTYYEANPQAAYYLLRSGKILNVVEERLGKYAARVMETILSLGHVSIMQLETLPELQSLSPPNPTRIANGDANGDEEQEDGPGTDMDIDQLSENNLAAQNGYPLPDAKPAPLHATIKALASHGYLMSVRDSHFQSPSDNWISTRQAVSSRSDVKALKGKRLEETVFDLTKSLVAENTAADLSQRFMVNGLPRGIKRKLNQNNATLNSQPVESNGLNAPNGIDDADEENEWSEDEDGFMNSPLEVIQ